MARNLADVGASATRDSKMIQHEMHVEGCWFELRGTTSLPSYVSGRLESFTQAPTFPLLKEE